MVSEKMCTVCFLPLSISMQNIPEGKTCGFFSFEKIPVSLHVSAFIFGHYHMLL